MKIKLLVHIYKMVLNLNFVDHENAFLTGKMLYYVCVCYQRGEILSMCWHRHFMVWFTISTFMKFKPSGYALWISIILGQNI